MTQFLRHYPVTNHAHPNHIQIFVRGQKDKKEARKEGKKEGRHGIELNRTEQNRVEEKRRAEKRREEKRTF